MVYVNIHENFLQLLRPTELGTTKTLRRLLIVASDAAESTVIADACRLCLSRPIAVIINDDVDENRSIETREHR